MTFVTAVTSHLTYYFFRQSTAAPTTMPDTEVVLKPLLVPPALRFDRGPHVFADPVGGFLAEKLCCFFPTGMFIHVPTMYNLYDSFQFTLQLHRTTLVCRGRKYLWSERLHITILSLAFSPEFLYSLNWKFWCNFSLLLLIFWQGKGRLLYHALKFNPPEVYDLQSSGCKAFLCLYQFTLQKSKPAFRYQTPLRSEDKPVSWRFWISFPYRQ